MYTQDNRKRLRSESIKWQPRNAKTTLERQALDSISNYIIARELNPENTGIVLEEQIKILEEMIAKYILQLGQIRFIDVKNNNLGGILALSTLISYIVNYIYLELADKSTGITAEQHFLNQLINVKFIVLNIAIMKKIINRKGYKYIEMTGLNTQKQPLQKVLIVER